MSHTQDPGIASKFVRLGAWSVTAATLLCLLAPVAVGAESAPAGKKKGEQASPPANAAPTPAEVSEFQRASRGSRKLPTTTITNEDLERMFGPPAPTSEAEPVAAPMEAPAGTPEGPGGTGAAEKTPLEAMADQERARLQKQQDLAAASTKVDELRKRVDELDQRARAVRNPLLPRPTVPPEQQEEWSKLGAAERAARTDNEVAVARAELAGAEAELARLKAAQP